MPGTGQKNPDTSNTRAPDSQPPVYKTAIYARLSVEDSRGDSIESQVQLLKDYVNTRRELVLAYVFADNGVTGTHFNRPGFTALLEEVKKSSVNCILVKDLSRFGRNYLEAGHYLEKIFPFLGVRFISVNDGYDSLSFTANEALALSVKNVCHHLYAKDISRKVSTVLEVKKKQGMFLGRFAPYGYKKSGEDKYKLEVEEETAWVVRDIFKMRLEGRGVAAIARALNQQGVPSYNKMLFERGWIKGSGGEAEAMWSGGSVKGILENPVYLGCLVERKGDYAYYKPGQKGKIPPSEWNIIENTHKALIDRAAFEKAGQLIRVSREADAKRKSQTGRRQRSENMLKGLLICGHCKRSMVRDGGYYQPDSGLIRHRFYCGNKYKGKADCPSASLSEPRLLCALSVLITAAMALLADEKELRKGDAVSFYDGAREGRPRSQADFLEARILQLKRKTQTLYQDYRQGLVAQEAFLSAQAQCEDGRRALERRLSELRESQKAEGDAAGPGEARRGEYPDVLLGGPLTRSLCLALIEGVEALDDELTIRYRFRSEFEIREEGDYERGTRHRPVPARVGRGQGCEGRRGE